MISFSDTVHTCGFVHIDVHYYCGRLVVDPNEGLVILVQALQNYSLIESRSNGDSLYVKIMSELLLFFPGYCDIVLGNSEVNYAWALMRYASRRPLVSCPSRTCILN